MSAPQSILSKFIKISVFIVMSTVKASILMILLLLAKDVGRVLC